MVEITRKKFLKLTGAAVASGLLPLGNAKAQESDLLHRRPRPLHDNAGAIRDAP